MSTTVVTVVGVVVSLCMSLYVAERPGVWYSQVNVLFLAPRSEQNPNALLVTTDSLITVAGLVQQQTSAGAYHVRTASTKVRLVDDGVRDGYAVTLPNAGGQYENNFTEPKLDVEVVGPDRDGVAARMAAVLARIDRTTQSMQQDAGTAPRNLITTGLSPGTPTLTYQVGNRARAAAAGLGLGLGLTAALGALLRRRGRPRPLPSATHDLEGAIR